MSRIGYYEIEEAVAERLRLDDDLQGVSVEIEEETVMQRGPIALILLDRRDAPAEIQSISANTRTRQLVQMEVWCFHFSLEKRTALRLRDELVGKVEIALLRDPSLGGTVTQLFLTGGEFENVIKGNDGFRAGASVQFTVDVTGTR